MTEAIIKVEGMSCMHCVGRIKKALEGLKGIQASDVQIGLVKVTFDEKNLSRGDIEKAVVSAGYKVAA
ncbi:MAG TPA: heavy-metal-associated domain-containing protein [Thermodesulfovibrionales bacterium]|nr:heavy-metal-associated domain-containing protein [Thermodesulfovibrionales bacterium]